MRRWLDVMNADELLLHMETNKQSPRDLTYSETLHHLSYLCRPSEPKRTERGYGACCYVLNNCLD